MQITAEPREDFTVLHLRGEFDTFYCPLLQKEVDGLVAAGVRGIVLNLRLVKFINSTALGAIIKASKVLSTKGGKLAISRPSKFCRDIIEKVGLDRVVPIHDTDEDAGAAVLGEGGGPKRTAVPETLEDDTAILFTPRDPARIEHFIPEDQRSGPRSPLQGQELGGAAWRGVGRMASLDSESLRFVWNGGSTGLTPFEMGQMLAIGTELDVKFRLPLLQRGHCEAVVKVEEVEERPDGVKLTTVFSALDKETKAAITQYARDMAYLKKELRSATDG
jgi:anti-anti-sigma factor